MNTARDRPAPIDVRCLIIEDSENDVILLVTELEEAGYRLDYRVVETEQDLLAALDDGPWDIVFSDFSMPRFNGLQAFELVRSRKVDVPFLMVSGTLGEENAVRAMRMGVTDYVLKDRRGRLPAAVARALDEFRQRRAMEAERDMAHRRLNAVIHQLPAILSTTDASLRITWIDGHGLRRTGTDPASLVGSCISTLFEDPEERARVLEHYARVLEGSSAELEFRMAGREFAMHLDPLRNGEKVEGVVGVSLDVTERSEMRRQVLAAQRMESLGRVAGGVAHDFNNVLGIVLGMAELVEIELAEAGEGYLERAQEELAELRKAGRQGVGLARQLLAVSRNQVLQPEVLDLTVLVGDLEPMLRRMAGPQVQLVISMASDIPPVLADPSQVEQVLMNLVVNAHDAIEGPGEIRVQVDTSEPDDGEGEPRVRIRVSDTGVGMTQEVQEQIFDPFYTTKGKLGTGLGLSTVHGIVMQSGGEVRLQSRPGEGSTFEILLPGYQGRPVRDTEVPTAARPARPPSSPDRRTRVLVVEDEESFRHLLVRTLVRGGYQVLEAASESEALALLQDHDAPLDVLVTDLNLADGSGLSLSRRILAQDPQTIVLVTSGMAVQVDDLEEIRRSGGLFLAKPFTPSKLLEVLGTELGVS